MLPSHFSSYVFFSKVLFSKWCTQYLLVRHLTVGLSELEYCVLSTAYSSDRFIFTSPKAGDPSQFTWKINVKFFSRYTLKPIVVLGMHGPYDITTCSFSKQRGSDIVLAGECIFITKEKKKPFKFK